MSEIKLKPCPFCGGDAELCNYVNSCLLHSSVAYVRCVKCGSTTSHFTDKKGNFKYMQEAIDAWNGRAGDDKN